MSTEDQRKEVVDLIRACLLSSKVLGHNTLTDFFSKARDVCRIMETNGRIIIHPVATESTHHIDNLVSHQKKSSAKGGKRRVQSQYGLSAGRRPNQRSNWIPPSPMNTNGNSNHPRGGRRPTNSRKVGSGRLPPRSSIANSTYRPYPSHQKLRTPSTHHSFTNNQSNSNHSNSYPLKIERSYVKDLTQYYQDKGYGTPEFKTSEMGSKKMRHRTYVSSVTVEGQSFRTFPIEYSSKELAEEAAARLAVDSLGLKRETQNNKHNDGFNFRQAGEINSLIADRIVEIKKEEPKVNSNNNGLENVDAQITSVHSDLKGDTKEDNFEELLSVDDNYSGKALPPISISEETYWDVYITVISNLTTDMELYYYDYSSKLPLVNEPLVGCLYAAKLDTDWHRVRVTNVHEKNVLGRSLVAEVVSRGEKGTDPTLILFDTSTEKDININKKILELSNEGVNCNSSILPSAGEEVVSVYLSYVFYLDINTLYLARNRSDNRWLRAALLTTEVIDEKVEIVHIDYGSHDEVDLSDLRDIGSTKLLSETPLSANIPCTYQWTEETTNRLKNLAPENKLLSLKVISSSGDTPELKELFIVNNQDFENSTSPTNKKEEYFDVTVTLAANPSTFYVKPWRQTESLEILTSEMIEFYSSPTRRVVDITLEDLSKDSFFAAVHSDGFWYRIKVDRVLDDQTITVKFVDYGDFAMAIKAFLSDIVPVNGDWTPADAIWFSNRSVNKQFVSVVKDISQEEDGSVKLGVSLIDVSHPKEDIIIDKLLVDEKRAVYLCI
ncbi:TDRD1_4_6_7 [Lepeophtheirus salmonis]|uniref:TDRD1_4_6_7 n=1 Tax=Lepeophtheirus salmonis TaxID=72036 RepID=A0A7R8H609_LEPSM|nr:TDRD1_4_6_7 [Lepeophtheirus salmonis]CAF2890608.1 TDRD1_4_6_7 [Lepeophtheirus salmonis]